MGASELHESSDQATHRSSAVVLQALAQTFGRLLGQIGQLSPTEIARSSDFNDNIRTQVSHSQAIFVGVLEACKLTNLCSILAAGRPTPST